MTEIPALDLDERHLRAGFEAACSFAVGAKLWHELARKTAEPAGGKAPEWETGLLSV